MSFSATLGNQSIGIGSVTITDGPPLPTDVYITFGLPLSNSIFSGYVYGPDGSSACASTHFAPLSCDPGGPITGKFHSDSGLGWLTIQGSLTIPGWSTDTSASADITFSFGGTQSEPERFKPWDYDEDDDGDDNDSTSRSIETASFGLTGAKLDVPVVQEHGFTDYVWAAASPAPPQPGAAPWNAAYIFASAIPFTKFTIPEALPGGDSEFKILIGEYEEHTLYAGVPFVFTDYFPQGVTAFLLTGFNADEELVAGESFPYTHGYQFAAEGGTEVRHGPLSPGDFSLGGIVNGYDLELWQAAYGVDGSADADGDGDSDGRDFLTWQRHYGAGLPPVAEATKLQVPEPATLTLVALAVAGSLARRHGVSFNHELRDAASQLSVAG